METIISLGQNLITEICSFFLFISILILFLLLINFFFVEYLFISIFFSYFFMFTFFMFILKQKGEIKGFGFSKLSLFYSYSINSDMAFKDYFEGEEIYRGIIYPILLFSLLSIPKIQCYVNTI